MKDVAFPPFPRASLLLKGQRAQSGEPAITRNSLLSYLCLLVVLLPWSSVAVDQETEKLVRNASVAPSLDGTLSQSALQHTLPRTGRQTLLPAASYRDSTLSNTTFGVATLPGGILGSTIPVLDGSSTLPYTTRHYGTFGAASFPPALFATNGVWPGSRGDYRGKNKEAGAGHDGTLVGDIVNDAGAASFPTMMDIPLASTFSRTPDARIRLRDSGSSSGLMASMPTLGGTGEGTLNPSDIRYSLTPILKTVHRDSLHPHVNPALCWANDKYGRFPSKPWYCSLICRLMARKVAEKEAAKYRNWKNALLSTSLSSPSSTGEWFNSKEFYRLAKAVLDASTRSPVVVFTKGHCRYCKDAIKLLQDVGVKQIYVVDLGRAPDMLKTQLVLEKLTGARTVPRIFIGGVCIGGLSDMNKEHENGTLKQRLKRVSAM